MKNTRIKTAVYSGTFDPFTRGHLDIVKRGLKIYDKIIIAVATSKSKKPMFNINSRIRFIQKLFLNDKRVRVVPFDSLMVEFLQENKVYNIIRGIRTIQDFEYELNMSHTNNMLDKNIDTIFLASKQKHTHISSSLVRELLRFNGDIRKLVSKKIYKDIIKEYKKCI